VESDWSARHGFLYVAAFPEEEREAAALELKAMTGTALEGGVARSSVACDVGASAYTKIVMAVAAEAESFEELVGLVADLGLEAEGFAVEVHRPPPKVDVSSIDCAKEIADAIAGNPDLDHPKIALAVVAKEGRYWFGRVVSRARRDWHDASERPENFSNSLPTRLARALVNMVAAPGDLVVDPCCGAGTAVVEAALVGAKVEGYDLNWLHVEQTRKNLEHYGLKVRAAKGDARELEGRWDAAVIDLPYGHTSVADDQLYLDVVGNVARRVKRLAVVTGHEKDYVWDRLGLAIRGRAKVPATRLVRHLYLLGGTPEA
jgi:tRNA G10  N-methylase Trm11